MRSQKNLSVDAMWRSAESLRKILASSWFGSGPSSQRPALAMLRHSTSRQRKCLGNSHFWHRRCSLPETGKLPCARLFAVGNEHGTQHNHPLPCAQRWTLGLTLMPLTAASTVSFCRGSKHSTRQNDHVCHVLHYDTRQSRVCRVPLSSHMAI